MSMDYDQMATDYAQHRRIHPGVYMSLLKAASAGASVLEVGCGTGNYIISLQESLGCASVGIDPSKEMLAHAASRSTQVHFRQGRAEQLDMADSSFDLVFSVDVIHHVQDRTAYFREAIRVLKPGGRICTVTDSDDIIRNRQPQSLYFPECVEPEIARYPRIEDLHQMMEAAGFQDIHETRVEHRSTLQDIQAFCDRAFSSLYLMPQEAFERGLRRMEAELFLGPIPVVSRYLLLWGTH
jgi:ubiquinone/menaquinone biosynthesis C-methylase UbiE